jgi:hypothetical protein
MLFQPIPAAASATGTLFGIVLNTLSVSSIDPASGATTNKFADLSLPGQLFPGFSISMADDPATHRLYLLRIVTDMTLPPPNNQTVQLVTVDTSSPGATPTAINLTQPLAGLALDTSSGTLFGITPTNCCPNTLTISIVTVNPSDGSQTTVVSNLPGDSFGLMAVDPATHLLYVTSEIFPAVTLLTVDTTHNVLLRNTPLPIPLRGLVFDPSPGLLFGTSFCCPAHFVSIDPSTLTEKTLGTYDFGMFLEPGLAIDTATHTVFTVQDVFDPLHPELAQVAHIVSINDQTGAGVLGGSTGTNVPALVFEPATAPPDTSPPTTSIAVSPAPNAASWNNANVTVNLLATDPDGVADVATVHYSAAGAQTIAPTVVAGSAASFVVNTEGVTTVTYFAADQAGNTEAALTKVIRIDKTLPTVTYTGNAGIYTVDQTVSITCAALDPPNANGTAASGLASTTCANVSAPAYSFPLGPNSLSASATDVAGNIGGGSSTFTVQVTSESLCMLTSQFIESSPTFLSLSPQAQRRWDRFAQRTCEIFDQGEGQHGPDDKAEKVKAYKKALTHLVDNGLLTPAQAATLLSLARAL